MPRLLANILLSFLMFPLGMMVYTAAMALADEDHWFGDDENALLFAGAVTWIFVAGYWLFIWFRTINWTLARRLHMLTAAGIALVAAFGVGVAIERWDSGFGYFMGSITAPIVWLIVATFVWRETKSERRERLSSSNPATIVCPQCAYNMTGLTDARCPECGTLFTLNELLSGQPARSAAEVAQL